MPELEAELRDALSTAAQQLTVADLRRPDPPGAAHRAASNRWYIAACIALIVALASVLGVLVHGHQKHAAGPDPSSLVGWVWSITEVTQAGVTTPVPAQFGSSDFSPNSFYFLADGRWGAADLLNAYEGTYALDGAAVRIHGGTQQANSTGGLPTTGRPVAAVLEVFKSGAPARVSIVGNAVTLRFGNDRIVATRPAAISSPIIGGHWRLTQVRAGTQLEQLPGNAEFTEPTPTIGFSRAGVASLTDLSLMRSGHYTVSGSTLTLHDIQLHPRISGTQDPALTLLNGALRELETPGVRISFTIAGSQLTLVAGEYTVLAESLSKEPAPTPTPTFAPHRGKTPDFVGYQWNITAVEHDGTRVTIPAALKGSVTFTSRGEFGASDGVNGSGGMYQLTAHGYVARNVATTLIGSRPEPTRDALIRGVQALDSANTEVLVRTSGRTITLSQGGYVVTGTRGIRIRAFADLQPVRDPAKLTGVTWTLTGISRQPNQVGGRPTFEAPDAAVAIEFTGPAGPQQSVTLGCASSSASVAEGQVQFGTPWSRPPGCAAGAQLGAAQAAFVFRLLSRNCYWSTYQGVLTIARAGVGTLRFHR